mgnify:FL=1
MSEKLSTTPILLLKFLMKLIYKENIVIGTKAEGPLLVFIERKIKWKVS